MLCHSKRSVPFIGIRAASGLKCPSIEDQSFALLKFRIKSSIEAHTLEVINVYFPLDTMFLFPPSIVGHLFPSCIVSHLFPFHMVRRLSRHTTGEGGYLYCPFRGSGRHKGGSL